MNGRTIVLLVSFLMFVGGFGLVTAEYFYEIGFSLLHLIILGGIGLIGLIILLLTIRAYLKNWYWHEIHKEHVIAFAVIIVIIVLVAWHYGVIDWVQSIL